MADYSERMAQRIRSERERRGLSHMELAVIVGSTDRTVRRWERGESEPQPRHLRALAEAFEKNVADIRPPFEAEEREVLAQLDRIEAKLDLLLSPSGTAEARRVAGEAAAAQAKFEERLGRVERQGSGGAKAKPAKRTRRQAG